MKLDWNLFTWPRLEQTRLWALWGQRLCLITSVSPPSWTESGNEQKLHAYFGKWGGRKEGEKQKKGRNQNIKGRKRESRTPHHHPATPVSLGQLSAFFRFIFKDFRKQMKFLELHTPRWHNPNPSPTWEDSGVKRRKDRFGSQIWNLPTCWLYDHGANLSVPIHRWACASVIWRDELPPEQEAGISWWTDTDRALAPLELTDS